MRPVGRRPPAPSSARGSAPGKAGPGALGSIGAIDRGQAPNRWRALRRPLVLVPALAALVAVSVWEGHLGRDSPGAHASVLVVAAAAALAAGWAGRGYQRRRSGPWLGATVRPWRRHDAVFAAGACAWGALFAAVVAWDLTCFVRQAHSTPTLSWVVGHLTRYWPGRALVFAVWVVAGAWLAVGGLATVRRRRRGAGGGGAPR